MTEKLLWNNKQVDIKDIDIRGHGLVRNPPDDSCRIKMIDNEEENKKILRRIVERAKP
ncbi:hypothetical protein ACFL6S_00725 [Candidatus Poribacteria bacterium]